MARKLYDIAAKTGEYQDHEGNKKGRWQNVGAVMQNDDGGQFIMLARWFNPAGVPDLSGKGGEAVLLSLFEPRNRDSAHQAGGRQASGNQPPLEDDGIPF